MGASRKDGELPSTGGVTAHREVQGGSLSRAFSEDEWGKAQQRLLLYLRSQKVPPFKALELALEALQLARRESEQADSRHPVTAAMWALRQLLIQRQASSNSEDTPKGRLQQMILQLPFPEESDLSRGIHSMPPLNRGVMVSERVHQRLRPHSPTRPVSG